jgi:uncharacterized protein YjbJ (UPF0337 family)
MSPKKASKKTVENKKNEDVLVGKWKQVRGQAKQWWGKLTDDDLDRVAGKHDKLVDTLMEKYGYKRGEAERAADEFLSHLPGDPTTDAPPPKKK